MRTSAEVRLETQAGPSRASLFSLTLTGVSGLRRLEMIPVKTVSNTGWRTGQCKVRIPLWASSWRVSKAWSLLGKVTVTLGRGLGQARYEYLWKSSLVGVAAWSPPRHQRDSTVDLGVISARKSLQPWLSTPGIILESTSGMVKPRVDPDPVFRSSTPGKLLLRLVKTLAKTKAKLLTPGKLFFRLAPLCLGSDTIFRLNRQGRCRHQGSFSSGW